MLYIKWHVMDAIVSTLDKSAYNLPLEFWKIKRKIPMWNNTLLDVVVQRIKLNGTFSLHVAELKKIMAIGAIYIKN